MDILLFADPAPADIAFVRNDQSRCQGAYRNAGTLVMVSDCTDYGSDLLRRKIHTVQDPESHHRSGLAVVDAVHHIADIVQVPRNFGKLHLPGRIAQRSQNLPGGGWLCI